ncbi:hypothetical protein FB451DRAFT_1098704 [Mycena latifolia]|nr:hypothetical protein FB451DRAFT_1098704 [Mycena latifolia]
MRLISRIFLAECLFGVLSYAASTNRTIDDTDGDSVTGAVPTYTPSSSFAGPSCSGCAIQPSTDDAFDGTWSAATYNSGLGSMSISMDFTGIAIYVYFILANDEGDGITTTTKANFSIDGTSAGTFTHTPTSSTDLQYNALVFSQTGLSNAAHSLLISTEGADDIYVNFDYAIYTHEDTDSTTTTATATTATTATTAPTVETSGTTSTKSSSTASVASSKSASSAGAASAATSSASSSTTSSHVGAIAGGVVGGIVALAVIAGLFFYCRRRHHRMLLEDITQHQPTDHPDISFQSTASPTSPTPVILSVHQNLNLPNPHGSDVQSEIGSSYPYGSEPYGPYRGSTAYTHSTTSMLPSTAGMASAVLYSDHEPRYSAPGFPIPSASGAQTKFELHRARQMDLERQTQEIHQELEQLTREDATTLPGGEDDTRRKIKEQIQALQRQQGTPWAQGLTNEAPPSYTPISP